MKQANPKAVGAFILGGIAIAIAVIVVFGSGIFSEKSKFVAFFPNTLQGLRVGSSVELRGVQVGAVTSIDIQINDDLEYLFPVTFEIERNRLKSAANKMKERGVDLKSLIDNGFRARLNSVSFVTGQQSIQLDFYPDSPVVMADNDYDYPQIPTVPSRSAEIEESLQDVVSQASKVLSDINDLLSDENRTEFSKIMSNANLAIEGTGTMIKAFTQTAETINKAAGKLDEDLGKLDELLQAGEDTLVAYKGVADRADKILSENEDGIRRAVSLSVDVEEKIGALASSLQRLIDDNGRAINQFSSEGLVEITNLAVDAQGAVEQFRRVMEEMERDPARFFLGSPGEVRGE